MRCSLTLYFEGHIVQSRHLEDQPWLLVIKLNNKVYQYGRDEKYKITPTITITDPQPQKYEGFIDIELWSFESGLLRASKKEMDQKVRYSFKRQLNKKSTYIFKDYTWGGGLLKHNQLDVSSSGFIMPDISDITRRSQIYGLDYKEDKSGPIHLSCYFRHHNETQIQKAIKNKENYVEILEIHHSNGSIVFYRGQLHNINKFKNDSTIDDNQPLIDL